MNNEHWRVTTESPNRMRVRNTNQRALYDLSQFFVISAFTLLLTIATTCLLLLIFTSKKINSQFYSLFLIFTISIYDKAGLFCKNHLN